MAINSICLRWRFPGWRSFQVAVVWVAIVRWQLSWVAIVRGGSCPNAVLRELYRSVATKREFSYTAKLSVFKSVFVPVLTYGHESWVMTERILSQLSGASGKNGIFVKSPRCNTGAYRSEMAAGARNKFGAASSYSQPGENLQQDHCISIANALMMVAGITEKSVKMSFKSFSLPVILHYKAV